MATGQNFVTATGDYYVFANGDFVVSEVYFNAPVSETGTDTEATGIVAIGAAETDTGAGTDTPTTVGSVVINDVNHPRVTTF